MYLFVMFFFNDTATTEIYTLSLHDALPISERAHERRLPREPRADQQHQPDGGKRRGRRAHELRDDVEAREHAPHVVRSEEHTSELQSRQYLVCRLLLEKKKKSSIIHFATFC